MPELPEVETIKNSLVISIGSRIDSFTINKKEVIRHRDFEPQLICGRKIDTIYRRGKYLVFQLEHDLNLVVHLGMSGRLYMLDEEEPITEPHVHVIINLDNGKKLVYQDARRFGGLWFVRNMENFFSHLGREPLKEEFTSQYLEQIIAGRKIAIKSLLLNQNLIAGIGNIYADEALFEAEIRPDRPAGSLSADEVRRLHRAIKQVLVKSIEQHGTTFRDYRDGYNQSGNFQNYLKVYGKPNQPCPRCQTPLKRERVGGRSSHFCERCQK